jgi:Zn-dependent protease with chaperone function
MLSKSIAIFGVLILLANHLSYGQYENDYVPLECEGIIPADFTSLISENYQSDISEVITSEDSRFEKKSKDDFVKISYSYLQEVLGSGKVLFGDPVTNYLNEIKDLLLVDQPEWQKKIRIYTLKSSVPNAMATSPGIIFVTVGLLALFENEAELAFVLSHEIAHVFENHSIDQYIEGQKIIEGKEKYRHNSFQDAVLTMSSYSQTQEFEADMKGAALFQKTDYNLDGIYSTFDLLQVADFPFEEARFDFNQLKSSRYAIPDSIVNFNYSPLSIEERDVGKEKYQTHPHAEERKNKIRESLVDVEANDKLFFLISKERFYKLRTRCRFEMIELNLVNQDYIRCISHISVLQKEFPNNNFLKRALAKAFYGLYKVKRHLELKNVKNETNYTDSKNLKKYVFGDTEESMGYEQILVNFFQNIELDMLNALALKLFLDVNQTYSSYDRFEVDAAGDLLNDHDYGSLTIQESTILYDHFGGERFKNAFAKARLEKIETEEIKFSENSKKKRKQEDWLAYTESQLGIDTLITITPFYLRTSERKGDKHLETEEIQINYSQVLAEESKQVGIVNHSFNPLLLDSSEVASFNDLSDLNEWFMERISIVNIDMIPLSSDFVQDQVEAYGTSKLLYTGVLSEIRQKEVYEIVGAIMVGVACFPVAPLMIYIIANPYHETFTFYMIFDFETGQLELQEVTFFERLKDAPVLMESQMNDFLYRIHTLPTTEMPR